LQFCADARGWLYLRAPSLLLVVGEHQQFGTHEGSVMIAVVLRQQGIHVFFVDVIISLHQGHCGGKMHRHHSENHCPDHFVAAARRLRGALGVALRP
jgi:hypothetical protein